MPIHMLNHPTKKISHSSTEHLWIVENYPTEIYTEIPTDIRIG